MQDFQPIPGLAGRIFTGSDAAAAARRLRNYPSSSIHNQQSPQAPIKCPRCESTNTKFCYYNNYNLSQPRHFCKSCRRYWTKGGVLRNVPVGGGCRKNSSKRSSSSSSKSSKPDKNRSKPATAPSGSSSESSSTLTAPPNPIPEPDPAPSPNPILDPPLFAETVASSFTGLMAGGPPDGFSFADPGPLSGYRISDPQPAPQHQQQQQQEAGPYVVDPTDPIQKAAAAAGGLNGLDWGAGVSVDSGSLFDITSSVDPAAYWNQNHWGDADPSLYLP